MEKTLPQNIEAEQGVLGSIIIDPDAVAVAMAKLQPRDFYRQSHREIFEAIVALSQRDVPADFITISNEMEAQGTYESSMEITSLVRAVPTSGNVEYYADLVARASQLRDVIQTSGLIFSEAYEPGANADEVLSKAQQKFFEIATRSHRGNGFTGPEELMAARIQRLGHIQQYRGTILGVPTGFTDLDRMTGGLQRSDLISLAARPGVGKTSFALSLAARSALKYGQRIAIFSLEMSKEQLGDRLLSTVARIDQQRLRTGWIEEDEWQKIIDAGDRIADSNIWIDDTAGISPLEMRNKARQLQADKGIDLIIVDYLQLMQVGGSKKFGNRVEEVTEITRSLKGLARELNVPVLALSQLSRAVESRQSKVPQLSDLRESGSIEQDSDIVMFIYRDEIYNQDTDRKNIADLIVAKHRNGPVGELNFRFTPSQTCFDNLEDLPDERW